MLVLSVFLSALGLMLLNHNGQYTEKTIQRLIGYGLLIASAVVMTQAMGVLRGTFVFLGLISLAGTLLTLLLSKPDKST